MDCISLASFVHTPVSLQQLSTAIGSNTAILRKCRCTQMTRLHRNHSGRNCVAKPTRGSQGHAQVLSILRRCLACFQFLPPLVRFGFLAPGVIELHESLEGFGEAVYGVTRDLALAIFHALVATAQERFG